MLSMKQAVPIEVAKMKLRTQRSLAMKRILPEDAAFITTRLDEIEARVVLMPEYTETGEHTDA